MIRNLVICGCSVLSFLLGEIACGQHNDSAYSNNALARVLSVYHSALEEQRGLFNGRQYNRLSFPVASGHPYFLVDSFQTGSVWYDGVQYEKIMLLYDEIDDLLITRDVTGIYMVLLNKDRVERFTIAEHRFIHLKMPLSNLIKPGFYQLLYQGRSQVLRKEVKSLKERFAGNQIEKHIEARSGYLVKIGEQYHRVGSEKALFLSFGDKRKEVKELMRENYRGRFNRNPGEYAVWAVNFFDQLTR